MSNPHLNERIQYVGSVGPAERDKLLGGASALLHLIHFDEPFGLSMVEALACGTPVIATRRGSVPEVIQDGVNGFTVQNVDEAVTAIERLGEVLQDNGYGIMPNSTSAGSGWLRTICGYTKRF